MQGIAFGPTIRLLRQAKGISLREMARQLGVSPAFLSQIEAGRQHKIPRARIVQVAEMLGVSDGYLLGTAKQVHPDLMKFLSETPEAAEFMVTAMRSGMIAQDFTNLREIVLDKKLRAGVKPVSKKKPAVTHNLDGYVDASLCLAGVAVQNKERLFQRFAKAVAKKNKSISADLLLDRMLARERQAATSIGGGVAIPHAFLQGIEKPMVGAFLLQRPIPYGPSDNDRVKTVFFLVGREGNTEHHLPILARIARLCSTPEFLQVLSKAKNARDIHKTIVAWDARIGAM
ncbi:MAG TPA: PTS sugar transporter subunit IIA [Candidatus Krumholzibacteria bacterium]|nr:PTS sugar transporter subunit IIA [Candidatus Krumholzibacteria bacterium]